MIALCRHAEHFDQLSASSGGRFCSVQVGITMVHLNWQVGEKPLHRARKYSAEFWRTEGNKWTPVRIKKVAADFAWLIDELMAGVCGGLLSVPGLADAAS